MGSLCPADDFVAHLDVVIHIYHHALIRLQSTIRSEAPLHGLLVWSRQAEMVEQLPRNRRDVREPEQALPLLVSGTEPRCCLAVNRRCQVERRTPLSTTPGHVSAGTPS